jgi:hypothetical protein
MRDEQVIGEVEEGLIWFFNHLQAMTCWLWAMVSIWMARVKMIGFWSGK